MNVYCDNYKTCNSVILDWSKEPLSEDRVRAAGWRMFTGLNLEGTKYLTIVLCGRCAGNQPRPPKVEVLEGQEELFPVEESGEDK